ncbi:hypothetical protein OUZ56_021798 [Daphnia magna]|uniref:Uncharacterized protein n=1 Tax=Daphnia magna TaxID=35525 RepID=A0ABR0AUP6_9CRUS|nr:hypothetical protein OUZ56_021798 [Daphnia magna]
MPLKGCWILIAAKNWIYEDVLYTPDNSYTHAYKLSLLKDGKDPDIITWERSHSFKVIHQFDSYEEARENLPRAEKGLPIFTRSSDIGRGHRQRIEKSLKLPGELSTTEQESEQEEDSLTQTKKSTVKKKSTPVKRKSSSETTKLPLPPPTLRSKITPNSSNKIAKSTMKIPSVGTALAGPSVLSDRWNAVNNVRSCSTQVMSFQKSNEIHEKQYDNDMHIDSDSSEEGNTHGDTNDMQSIPPYRNDSQMMTIYTPQPTPSPSPCEPSDNSQQYSGNYKKNGGISSNKDFREMEISAFECETKTFLKNSKATYDRKANAPGKDGEDSEDTTENY